MSEVEKKLKEFAEYLKKINHYTTAGNLMYWDMTTGMPEAMAETRAETLSFFQTEVHNLNVSPKIEEFIKFFESHMDEFDYTYKRMTKQLKKDYEKQKRYPEEFIREFSLAASRGEVAWEKAKNASDFEIFKPALEKIVELTKKSIEYKGYKDNKYDALLDDYEAGLTVEKLDKVFGELRDGIVEILNKIKSTGKEIDDSFFHKEWMKQNILTLLI